jgi:hypothetical protein
MVILSKKPDIVQREVSGDMFLVPIRGRLADLQELFVLNDTGRWIWARLEDGGCNLERLAEDMVAEFEVDEATALIDAQAFAAQLVEAGLGDCIPDDGV